MSLVVTYESGLSSEFTDISDRFREYAFDLAQDAEEGSVAVSTVIVDDPEGDYDIKGWRRFRFYENAAAGSNTLIANVWVTDRQVIRGPYKTGAGRQWVCQVADMNSVLAFRVFTQSDANRPAETDIQRLAWMQGELGTPGVPETEYVDTSGPVAMDAVDYRGQTRLSVIDDCAQASGKNYFVYTKESTPLSLGLWYAHTASTMYTSPLRLTNVHSDIDGDATGNTFAIAEDSELKRDPSRVYSGAYIQYDGGQVFEEDLSISNEFTRRDAIVPAENVKTNAKATARALRYLDDFRTEADRISTAIILPAAKVNFVREGMRVQYRASHHPGYEDFSYLRVLQRKVKFNSEQADAAWLVSLELASEGPSEAAGPDAGPGNVYYEGDNGLEVWINGTFIGDNSSNHKTVPVSVAPGVIVPGDNVLAIRVTNGVEPSTWALGNPTFLEARLIPSVGGLEFVSTGSTVRTWDVSNTDSGSLGGTPANWDTAAFDDSGWAAAIDVTSNAEVLAIVGGVPPVPPARYVAPAGAPSGSYARGLVWLARMDFTAS